MPSARMKVVLLLVGALALAGLVVLAAFAAAPARAPAADADGGHALEEDARCAHMPEHCRGEGGRARG